MKDSFVEFSKLVETKLENIKKLLDNKKYQEALAEIRDLESTQEMGQLPSNQLSHLYYLQACVFRFLGGYNDALDKAMKAFLPSRIQAIAGR